MEKELIYLCTPINLNANKRLQMQPYTYTHTPARNTTIYYVFIIHRKGVQT